MSLRQLGFDGSIGLLGDELVLPYERPALSKEYLAGTKAFDELLLFPQELWAGRDVTLCLGRRVIAVDAETRIVTCEGGAQFGYGVLVWAAGGRPRKLTCPGHDLRGIHAIRGKADCDRLISALPRSGRIAVIGGGYIGLEAAAVLREMGKKVTVIEAQDRVLARVTAEPVSRFYEAEHRARGVELRLGTGVAGLVGCEGAVTGVQLTDSTMIDADQVIVGTGITPATQPLLRAGADAAVNGVLVDDSCRTMLAGIYCVGDCAVQRSGPGIRIESRHNAHEQAQTAARAICGQAEPLRLIPWFWSNQYDLRLQTVGISHGYDARVLRGNPEKRSFSLIYLRDGAVVALDCINAARDYAQGRKLVSVGTHIDPALLADEQMPLNATAPAARPAALVAAAAPGGEAEKHEIHRQDSGWDRADR
jgi:3-phenylpropionate/trans-cinnamate dioxygenase ferredoxin reductase component